MRYTRPRRGPLVFALALLLSGLGAAIKLYGGARYGSLSVIVDGITCVANLAAGAFLLYTILASERPADIDHPYGHKRYIYTGILGLLVAYSFSMGLSTGLLILTPPEGRSVGEESALYAVLGGAVYGLAVAVSSRGGVAGASYAGFTMSEVLESAVSAAGALLGAKVASILDYLGAIVITAFIAYEILENAGRLHRVITDWASPRLVEEARRAFERRGLRVASLRLRMHSEDTHIGEAVVAPGHGMPLDVAELLAEEAAAELRDRGVHLTVRVERRHGETG